MSLKIYWPVMLALLAIFLQPFGRMVELPVLMMSLIGLFDLAKNIGGVRAKRSFKVFNVLFISIWLPAFFSIVDAVNFDKSVATWVGMLRFYLAGVFILGRLATPQNIKVLVAGTAFITFFWASDNLFQAITGFDYFGRPMIQGRIPGIFGDSPRSGWMLIPLAFVAILYFWKQFKKPLALFLVAIVFLAIVLSGDRGAVVAAFWAMSALLIFRVLLGYKFELRTLSIGFCFLCLSAVLAMQVPQIANRFEKTTAALGQGYEQWDKATSYRLTLWSTAMDIVEDNPLNGVGVRGFRYAYPSYAPEGDRFVNGDIGAYHAHQIIIELLAETGLFGLVGYIVVLGVFIRLVREAILRKTYLALGYLASVVGVLMPINSHLSLYSSYWAQTFWFLFAVTVVTVYYESGGEKAEV